MLFRVGQVLHAVLVVVGLGMILLGAVIGTTSDNVGNYTASETCRTDVEPEGDPPRVTEECAGGGSANGDVTSAFFLILTGLAVEVAAIAVRPRRPATVPTAPTAPPPVVPTPTGPPPPPAY